MDQRLHKKTSTAISTSDGWQQQPSLLESLPTEVLTAILSAAYSTTDLYALIRASPSAYEVFRPVKMGVLISVMTGELGLALRDAVAATLIAPAMVERRADSMRVIQQYKGLLCGNIRGAVKNLSPDEVVALVRVTRGVQFLVDEYAASRLSELQKIHPEAASPLTASERQRLAQAMLRSQVITRINFGVGLPDKDAIMITFFELFKPWEAHQFADAHDFIGDMLLEAFRYCRQPRMVNRYRLPSRLENEMDMTLRDLSLLHLKLVTERDRVAADPKIVTENGYYLQEETIPVGNQFRCPSAGPVEIMWTDRVAREQNWRGGLYLNEDAMPLLEIADETNFNAAVAPPFAWVDGHGGLDCQRWGKNVCRVVLPAGQEDTTPHQRLWMENILVRWRWLGFVFWDRARTELLKAQLPIYATGWLRVAPPPNEECDLPQEVEGSSQLRRKRRVDI
jgi:hypothetical protein